MAKPIIIVTRDGTVELERINEAAERVHVRKRWGRELPPIRMKQYVVRLDGKRVGTVQQEMATFERKPRGSRIVTKRWSNVRWFYDLDKDPAFRTKYGERRSSDYETRLRAVEGLMHLRALRLEQAAEAPADIEFVDDGRW